MEHSPDLVPGVLVLVTGATGAIGPGVVAELLRSGYRVRTLALVGTVSSLPPEVESRWGDITDPIAVAAAVDGAAAVVHLAARLHLAGPPSRDIEAYKHVNVRGTATVVEAATQAGVRRVVYASTISVYGPSRGTAATEAAPLDPDTPYAVTKLAAEDIVRGARRDDATPMGTVLRLAAVYGPKVKGNYRALVKALAAGRFFPIGNGNNRRTLIHERDVARAIVHVLESPQAAGRTYNVTDGQVHTTDDIVRAICGALGRRPPRLHIPAGPAFALASAFDTLTGLVGLDSNPFHDRLKRYTEDVAVDGSLIVRETGFTPMFQLDDGWKDVIRGMEAAGDVGGAVRNS